MEVEIINTQTSKSYGVANLPLNITVGDAPEHIHKQLKKTPTAERQSLRLEARGKSLKVTDKLQLNAGDKLYIKDLGPQIGWKTVFLAEYAGPLVVYLLFYMEPIRSLVYGTGSNKPLSLTTHLCEFIFIHKCKFEWSKLTYTIVFVSVLFVVVLNPILAVSPLYNLYILIIYFLSFSIAAGCYTVHYAKRLLETIFIHRFSHATMPIANLFKNCTYYWGFTAYVSYHINHPLYTSPCMFQVWLALTAFTVCELGNLSVHIAFRNMRPAGTKVRKIPMPDGNPFCKLFNLVSCPNYTYEIGAWLFFSVMTSCLPAFLFTAAGAYQMAMWAIGKHRNYKKEFPTYPKQRRVIFPFVL